MTGELECHLWSMFTVGLLPKLLNNADSYKGQHSQKKNLRPRSSLSDLL